MKKYTVTLINEFFCETITAKFETLEEARKYWNENAWSCDYNGSITDENGNII